MRGSQLNLNLFCIISGFWRSITRQTFAEQTNSARNEFSKSSSISQCAAIETHFGRRFTFCLRKQPDD